jgi:cytochrome c-type biogenesis protein CcmH
VATSWFALVAVPTTGGQGPESAAAQESTRGAASGAAPKASLPDIEDEVMCPICGTALNLSEAPQAERERAFIRRLIAEGKTKDEIKDALVAEYGEQVLATPEASGFDLTAWVVPGAAILLGALGIGFAVRRWRASGASRRDPAAPRDPPIAAADAKRLDSDRARYDL